MSAFEDSSSTNKFNFSQMIEMSETNSSKYITLRMFHVMKCIATDDSDFEYNLTIRNSIRLKFFAIDFLRNAWRGVPHEKKVTQKVNK